MAVLTFDPQVIADLKGAIEAAEEPALAALCEQAMEHVNAVASAEVAAGDLDVTNATDLEDGDFQAELAAVTPGIPAISGPERTALDAILDALPEPLKTWGKHLKCALTLCNALLVCENTHGEDHTDPDAYDNPDFIACFVNAYLAYYQCRDSIVAP